MTPKLITLLSLIAISACAQKPKSGKADPAAIALDRQAMMLVPFFENNDSARKAVSLLDQATSIDSSYFRGYNDKLMFLQQLRQFEKAASKVDKMNGLRPHAHDLYLMGGLLHEKIGDTVLSKNYFSKSLAICNSVLDTMNSNNRDHFMLVMNKAINLIMLGDQVNGQQLLRELYDAQSDDAYREMLSPFINKNKKELLSIMTEQKSAGIPVTVSPK